MMKSRFLALMFVTGLCGVAAQTSLPELSEAETLYSNQVYGTALPFYLKTIKSGSAPAIIYYKAGVCYLNSRSQKPKALEYLEKAAELSPSYFTQGYAKETEAPVDVFKLLGDAYQLNYQFEKSVKSYQKYKDLLTAAKEKDETKLHEINEKIESAKFLHEFKQSVGLPQNFINAIVKNGGSDAGDFSSALSPDSSAMIYTLKVPLNKLKKFEDDKYFEETVINNKNKTVQEPVKSPRKKTASEKLADTIVNITTVGSSVDGQVVLTYRDDNGEGNLYVTRLQDNSWTAPAKLPKTANTQGWEQNEFVSPDGAYLYFVSNRTGGYGGKDIYRCKRLPNGSWSKAVNLGPEVNSEYDDQAPFMHPDGTTLYFSSNRFKPSLSYDIFTSTLTGNSWGKPLLVGYPVNSSEQDAFYQVSSSKKKVVTADATPGTKNSTGSTKDTPKTADEPKDKKKKKLSEKEQLKEDAKKLSDNYIVTFENPAKSALTMINGNVKTVKNEVPLNAEITIVDLETGKETAKFYSNKDNGLYSFIIPPGKHIAVTYSASGYLFQSENHHMDKGKNYYEKHQAVVLLPMEAGSTTTLNSVFFEEEKATINNISFQELDRVYNLLIENPGMKIKICNYIYTENKAYKKLAQERAEAIEKYFVDKGISKKRIDASGQRKSEIPGADKNKKSKEKEEKPVQQLVIEIAELKK